MKQLFILLTLFTICLPPLLAEKGMEDISTILVIVEEFENGHQARPFTPFADGIIDALWEEPYIFFDMKIDKPLNMTNDILHVKQYINAARDSGADSILLVKFSYTSEDVEAMIRLKIDKIYYHVYSLYTLKTLTHGFEEVNINELVELNAKNTRIKKLAYSFTKGIFH